MNIIQREMNRTVLCTLWMCW